MVGAAAIVIDRGVGAIRDIRRPHRKSSTSQAWTQRQWIIGSVFAISGAAAMSDEVGWLRLLGLTMGPSGYTLAAMLGTLLVGVGVGSVAAGRGAGRTIAWLDQRKCATH